MKDLVRKIGVIGLSIIVSLSFIPVTVFADENLFSGEIIEDNNEFSNGKQEYVDGEVIITYKEKNEKKVEDKVEDEIKLESDIEEVANINGLMMSIVKSKDESTKEMVKKLEDKNEIIDVEPNYIFTTSNITNDIYETSQWAIENNGQNSGRVGLDINPVKTSGSEKVIAVVDSGVDYTHEDLSSVMWKNKYGECGYDFINLDNDPMDDFGHGTHVAGIIAASSNNGKGVTGALLDNSNIKIMALKISNNEGKGTLAEMISAYKYIYNQQLNGVNIVAINNSNVSEGASTNLYNLINLVGQKGAVSVCSAGNAKNNNDYTNVYPANFNSDYVISVASSDENDNLSSFSNYGSRNVDIAAPGNSILSTVSYYSFNPSIYSKTQIDDMCTTYNDFEYGSNSWGKTTNFSVEPEGSAKTSVVSGNGFGKRGNNTLMWEFSTLDSILKFNFYVPTAGEYYISFMFYVDGQWSHENIKVNLSQGMNWMKRHTTFNNSGNHKVYFDDFAVSKVNMDVKKFGKYDFMSGTSMATPYVTAAVGAVSNSCNSTNAIINREKVLNAVRYSSGLYGKVAKNGTLDMSKIYTKISGATVSNISDKIYTGNGIGQDPVVKVNNAILRNGIDYTLTYSNNIYPGIAIVVIIGKGTYSGTILRTFKIVPAQTVGVAAKSQGKKDITVKWNRDTTVTGYEVYMATSKSGTYSKIATINNNSTVTYKKTGLTEGKTYYFVVRGYKTVNGSNILGDCSTILTTTTKTKTPTISKVVAGSKKATVKWNKIKEATGYEVYMSTSKSGKYKKISTQTKNSKVSYTKTKLKKGKKYYFKIRTYRTVDGKKVYSSYSSVKYTKVK